MNNMREHKGVVPERKADKADDAQAEPTSKLQGPILIGALGVDGLQYGIEKTVVQGDGGSVSLI